MPANYTFSSSFNWQFLLSTHVSAETLHPVHSLHLSHDFSNFFSVECILDVNYVLRKGEELEAEGGGAKLFITACTLFILSVGGVVFVFLQSRSKSIAITGAPKVKAGGYEKLDNNGGAASQATTSAFGDYSDRIIECENDEEDDEEDIVYMGQDGTVYRKFKYGLLDDDEIELEYDDESYAYRWTGNTTNLDRLKPALPNYKSIKWVFNPSFFGLVSLNRMSQTALSSLNVFCGSFFNLHKPLQTSINEFLVNALEAF